MSLWRNFCMKEDTKEKAKAFMANVKNLFDKGINASKKALGVAGDAVHDFSDKSVLRIERKQLESKLKKQYELLGEYACNFYEGKRTASLSSKDSKVAEILLEVNRIKKEIVVRDEALGEETEKDIKKVYSAKKIEDSQTGKKGQSKVVAKASSSSAKSIVKKESSKTSKTSKSTASKTTTKKVPSSNSGNSKKTATSSKTVKKAAVKK